MPDPHLMARALPRPQGVRFAVLEAADACAVFGLPESARAELQALRTLAAALLQETPHA